jgi:hypothetical protein
MKADAVADATELVKKLKDQIMGLPGMQQFIDTWCRRTARAASSRWSKAARFPKQTRSGSRGSGRTSSITWRRCPPPPVTMWLLSGRISKKAQSSHLLQGVSRRRSASRFAYWLPGSVAESSIYEYEETPTEAIAEVGGQPERGGRRELGAGEKNPLPCEQRLDPGLHGDRGNSLDARQLR